MNIIKQIVHEGDHGEQVIKMVVRDNERGPQGEKGVPGDAATIQAGQAYSVPSSYQPAVINTGSSSEAVFDFYIPQGKKGDKGEKGDDGAIQYKAGAGIRIKNNVISVIGGGGGDVMWGDILGEIADQTDLNNALQGLENEFDNYTPTADLAPVALSNSYNDLSDKPTIPDPPPQEQADWAQADTTAPSYIKNKPAINNATLTIKQNGTSVATFTANSSTDATAEINTSVITMTSTDPGEGQPLAADHFIGVYGDDPIIVDYSTSELNTGAKWVDGKAIYKKTVFFGTLPNASNKSVAHNISNLEYVVKLESMATSTGDSIFRELPHVSPTAIADQILVEVDPSYVSIYTGSNRTNYSAYVTIYYTKSA